MTDRLSPQEALAELESHFYIFARDYAETTEKPRRQALEACDAILDCYLTIKMDIARFAIDSLGIAE